MCGIAGLLQPGTSSTWLAERVAAMTAALAHRGPDGEGAWVEPAVGLVLGHRRLSIIDLSPTGAQPMVSPSGRYVIVFNGEIYNFQTLRDTVVAEGASLRGRSDTEVLLAAIDLWGLDAALPRCRGMFAFGLWDRQLRRLTLARDRCGEKPLYFGRVGGAFAFASELKAFRALPGWPNPVDPASLQLYFRHGCVPAPHSIHQGIHKLCPGELVEFDETGASLRQVRYWNHAELPARRHSSKLTDQQAIDELDRRLRSAVTDCMVSDVPLGAFLSGGLDSSAVVAIMQASASAPVRTFTIGFQDAGYDEAGHAARVARHLGTQHTEMYVTAQDALSIVPALPQIYDEPFADSSQIPTYIVARLARQDVVVCLSGDGGDELFGGYNRHTWGVRTWGRAASVPYRLRKALGSAATSIPGPTWDRLFQAAARLRPDRMHSFSPGDRIHKLARLLGARDAEDLYRRAVTHWDPVPTRRTTVVDDSWALASVPDGSLAERMMITDLGGYLPDDVLVKLDRAGMAVSLESRVPFLDHELVEFAWTLPLHLKIRDGQGKWLLRQVLARYLPKLMFERPKMGFAMPIDVWLRGPLRDWAEALLDPARLDSHGLLDTAAVRRCWHEHVVLGRQHQARLWDVLMFQAWHEEVFV